MPDTNYMYIDYITSTMIKKSAEFKPGKSVEYISKYMYDNLP